MERFLGILQIHLMTQQTLINTYGVPGIELDLGPWVTGIEGTVPASWRLRTGTQGNGGQHMAPNHSETGVGVMSPGKLWKKALPSPGLSPCEWWYSWTARPKGCLGWWLFLWAGEKILKSPLSHNCLWETCWPYHLFKFMLNLELPCFKISPETCRNLCLRALW